MRSEQEMTDLILGVAKADERIRAVFLSGSRANPNAPKDQYQDFDVAYLVTDIAPFYDNPAWTEEHFGKPLILQMPEAMRGASGKGHFNYQMIFPDGNRIDLSMVQSNKESLEQYNSLTVTLLDKDGIVPVYPPPTDRDFWINEPSPLDYYSCCNEFWWCLNNVVKGIARDQLPYAMRMYTEIVHIELERMTEWYIGINVGFSVTPGRWGKYFKKYLPTELYEMYTKTYSNGDYEHLWTAIFIACDLFHTLALSVAAHFGFTYRQNEEDGMREYLRMVKESLL